MPAINLPHLDYFKGQDPRYYEFAKAVQDSLNNIGQQTNASPAGTTDAPPTIASFAVTSSGAGRFDGVITDNSPANRGLNYFVERADNPQFTNAHVIDLGASRSYSEFLGNGSFYFRAYHSYGAQSPISEKVYNGSATAPTKVSGGGTIATGNIPASQGTGTSIGYKAGDGGYGNNPNRGSRIETTSNPE